MLPEIFRGTLRGKLAGDAFSRSERSGLAQIWSRLAGRRVSIAALAVLGMLTLDGCGLKISNGDDSPTPQVTPTPSSQVTPTLTPSPTVPPVEIMIVADPNSLRFGSIEVTKAGELDVYFRNNSTKTYSLTGLLVSQTFPAFSAMWIKENPCDADPTQLGPNSSVGARVTFRPAQQGNFKGSLTLTTGDDNPTVSLTGTGAPFDPSDDSPTPEPTAPPTCN